MPKTAAPSRRPRASRRPSRLPVSTPLPVITHLPVTAVPGGGESRPGPLARLLVLAPLVVALVGVVLAVLGAIAPGIVLAVLGLAASVAGRVIGSPRRLVASLGGRPTNPRDDPRLFNLIDGLCVANGLAMPEVRILDDPSLNSVVLGRTAQNTVLVLTSGLLSALDRMELEAVLAHELAHVRRGDLRLAAMAGSALGLAALVVPCGPITLRLAGYSRESVADAIGVRMTRYPPGLISALKKIERAESIRPSGIPRTTAHLTAGLWCAPLEESLPKVEVPGLLDLELRIAALREL